MQRRFIPLAILMAIVTLALSAFGSISAPASGNAEKISGIHFSQAGTSANSSLFASTPTPPTQRRIPTPKATPSPRAKQTPTPTAQPKRVVTNQVKAPSSPTSGSWIQIVSEGFEVCYMPCPGWRLVDLSNDGYERYWKDATYWDGTAYRANSGTWAGWPARGGADGYDPSVNNNYSNNMDTRMIYGPFDLSDAVDAEIYFFLWREIEPGFDFVSIEVSLDGINFQELARWDGFVQQWQFELVSLRSYTGYSMPTGYSQVWVAWRFYSDYSVTYQGPWVDDISIFKYIPGEVTAYGWVDYFDRNDARSDVRYATVHLYDQSTNATDLLVTLNTQQDGYFQFPALRNWEWWDPGDPNHMLDLYIVVEAIYNDSGSSVHQVTYFSGDTYKWRRPTSGNVPDGIVDLSYDIPITDSARPAMWIFQDLRRGWEYVMTHGNSDPGSVTATWQDANDCYPLQQGPFCNSFFYAPGQFIFIRNSDRFSSDTVIHETGHKYMFNATNWWWWNSNCWGHTMFASIDENCAWSEGWADFFALPVNGDPCYDFGIGPCSGVSDRDHYNLETQNRNDGRSKGDKVEGRVAGALYDLFDNTNEGYDQVFFGFSPIWNIIRTVPTETSFRDFSNSWIASGYDLRTSLLAFYQNTIDYLGTNYLPVIIK